MENETETKQNYLRQSILDKGYNADEFMSFLKIKKGDKGLDLGNWSMEELENTVSEFITIKNEAQKKVLPKSKTNKKETNKKKDKNQNTINNSLTNEETQKNQEYIENQLKSIFEPEFIVCNLSESTPISESGSVQIKLSSPEKVDGGIFGKSYVTYLIESSPFGFRVRKRYSDFEWLRNALTSIYVGCVIPPLCKKNYGDRFTEALVRKRTRLLQKFIEGILIHPLMRNSQIFYDFISIDNEEEFENKKKNFEKNLVIPVNAKDMKSFDGQIRISVSKEKEIYLDNIKDNYDINIKIMQQITKNYKILINLMNQASEKMKEISELWKKLYEKSQS